MSLFLVFGSRTMIQKAIFGVCQLMNRGISHSIWNGVFSTDLLTNNETETRKHFGVCLVNNVYWMTDSSLAEIQPRSLSFSVSTLLNNPIFEGKNHLILNSLFSTAQWPSNMLLTHIGAKFYSRCSHLYCSPIYSVWNFSSNLKVFIPLKIWSTIKTKCPKWEFLNASFKWTYYYISHMVAEL